MQNGQDLKAVAALAFCALALPLALPAPAPALHERSHTGRIVVPFAAGGPTDTVARIIAEPFGRIVGTTVVVENRPGAGGVVGVQAVKDAAPDGSVLLLTSSSPITLAPVTIARLTFNPIRDFAPVTQVGTFDLAIASSPRAPLRSVRELVEEARRRPGQISYAAPPGTLSHLLGIAFAQAAGIQLQSIPFRSSGESVTAVVSGNTQLVIAPVGDLVPFHRNQQVQVLAKSGTERSPLMPDVPTFREAGVAVETTDWHGIFVPAGIPADRLQRINESLVTAIRSPEVTQRLQAAGLRPTGTSPNEFAQIQQADAQFWQTTARAAGLTPQ